jgi:hypothetical protein
MISDIWREPPYCPGRALRHSKWIEPYTRGLDHDTKHETK